MARVLGALLGLALALTVVTAGDKFAVSHSVILEKFHPIVKQFSSSLTGNLDTSNSNLQAAVYETITQTLASQVDELVAKTNGSNVEFCCSCKKCTNKCTRCKKSCCCKGSGGCSCKSCATGPLGDAWELSLESVEIGTRTTGVQLWSAVTKELLVREVRSVVAAHSPGSNAKCCACSKCKTFTVGVCGFPVCCASGSVCVCKSCAQTDVIQLASMDNFVSLTSEAEDQVQQVSHLVDELVTLFSVL